jgi:hypothetical protein
MDKNAMKCNKTQSKWCINKHGASKIIDMFEMYQAPHLRLDPIYALVVNTIAVNTQAIKSDKQDVGRYPTRGPNLGKTYVSLCRLITVEFAGSPDRTMIRKPSSMGITGVEPCQLAPTMGSTGSGSTDSLAPSPIIIDSPASTVSINSSAPPRVVGSSPETAIDSASSIIDIYTALPTIDIDTTSQTINVDTASPTIDVDTASPTINDTTMPTVGTLYSPTIVDYAPMVTIDTPVAVIDDPISCLTGPILTRIGVFEMTFGLFNFHVDDDSTAELISIIDLATPAANLVT